MSDKATYTVYCDYCGQVGPAFGRAYLVESLRVEHERRWQGRDSGAHQCHVETRAAVPVKEEA